MNSVKEKIKEIRKKKGISQKQVADIAGISIAAYSNIEAGISKSISIEVGKGIASVLEVSFNELFEIEDTGTGEKKLKDRITELEQKNIKLRDEISKLESHNHTLESNRKYIITSIIKYLEQDPKYSSFWFVKQGYRYAKTKEQKDYIDVLLRVTEEQRKGMYDYFLNEGIITEDIIKQVHKTIEESYSKMDFEFAFKNQFNNVKNEE